MDPEPVFLTVCWDSFSCPTSGDTERMACPPAIVNGGKGQRCEEARMPNSGRRPGAFVSLPAPWLPQA